MSEAVMFDKVKAAMLKCSTKSEQLEEAAGQLTVQKLRVQLAIESRLSSLEQQLRTVGQQLLAELASNHDSWQAKIHHQQHLVLKYNMQLSSALAKEVVSTDLLSKVEENIVPGLKGLEVQFVPSTTLQGISLSDIGNLQFGHLLPFQVVLTFSTSTSMDDMKLITCVLTSNHMSEVESLKQILTVVVKKDQVVVDHRIEEEKSHHSTKLKVVFDAKCGGKYSVSASMYGEMVQGSPMVVEVAQGVGDGVRLPKVEDVMNNVKFVNNDDVSEIKEKNSLNDVKEAAVESKAINRKFDDLNEGEVKNCDVAATFKGGRVRAAIEGLSKTETGKAATDDLIVDVDETKANECRLNPSLEPEVLPLSKALDVPPSKAVSAPVFYVGSSCLVRWDEDKVWCRARVDNYVQGIYEVTFVDYGNKETVGIEDMVHRTDDIPADQLEMTDPLVWKWSPPGTLSRTA